MASVLNELIDSVITAVTECMNATNQRSMPIPDMDERFEKLMVEGGVTATQGTVEDLTTLRRSGDVTVKLEGSSAVIGVPLTLGLLRVVYKHCKAWLGPISTSDSLTVNVGKNQILVQISVEILKGCQPRLDFAKVVELSDVSVEFKGASGKITAPLVDVVTSFLHKHIEKIVEKELNEAIDEQVKKVSFQQIFSMFPATSK